MFPFESSHQTACTVECDMKPTPAFAAARASSGPAFAAAASFPTAATSFPSGAASSFPSESGGRTGVSGGSSWLQCSSFTPAPETRRPTGGGALAIEAFSADLMDDKLRAETFGGRISPGADRREQKGLHLCIDPPDLMRAQRACAALNAVLISFLLDSDR